MDRRIASSKRLSINNWVPVKCETKYKRNETKYAETKRNETKPAETKQNKRNQHESYRREAKQNEIEQNEIYITIMI